MLDVRLHALQRLDVQVEAVEAGSLHDYHPAEALPAVDQIANQRNACRRGCDISGSSKGTARSARPGRPKGKLAAAPIM